MTHFQKVVTDSAPVMTHFSSKMTHNPFFNLVPILSQFVHPADDGEDLENELSPGTITRQPIQPDPGSNHPA
jgi:hypothetical protein